MKEMLEERREELQRQLENAKRLVDTIEGALQENKAMTDELALKTMKAGLSRTNAEVTTPNKTQPNG
jgi:cell division septum initiation protein DivIVA